MMCSVLEAMCECVLHQGHTEDYHECKCGGRWPLDWDQPTAAQVTRFPQMREGQ